MANATLDLPIEIRLRIYKELLLPVGQRVCVYHDRKGRTQATGLYPNILRLSKATYAEAVDLLYEESRFLIYLSTEVKINLGMEEYPDEYGSVEELFKEPEEWRSRPDQGDQSGKISERGVLTKAALRKMRHIDLLVSCRSIWGISEYDSQATDMGRRVLPAVLRVLAEDEGGGQEHETEEKGVGEEAQVFTRTKDATKKRKTLKMASFPKWKGQIVPMLGLRPMGWRSHYSGADANRQAEDILRLLGSVSRARDLSCWLIGRWMGTKPEFLSKEEETPLLDFESTDWRTFLPEGESEPLPIEKWWHQLMGFDPAVDYEYLKPLWGK